MRAYFESFGEVKDAVVKIDANTGASRGFGFVIFSNEASIDAVFASGSHEIDGKKVCVLKFRIQSKLNSTLQVDPKKAERRDGKMFVGGVKPETTDETLRGKIHLKRRL